MIMRTCSLLILFAVTTQASWAQAQSSVSGDVARTSSPAMIGGTVTVTQAIPVPRAPSSFAERIATALAGDTEMQSSDPRPTIGVELRRETATFHIPVSEAALPEALKKLTGDALRSEEETPAAPQLEISSATTLPAITAAETQAILLSDESGPQEFDGANFEPPRVLRRMVE